jgi:hypothetical protein
MRKLLCIAVSVLFWSALTYTARPDIQKATHVAVTVFDQSGAVIPGAAVWIGRASDSLKLFLITDYPGVLVANIKPGKYEVDAQASGFREQRQPLTVIETVEQQFQITLQVGFCLSCVVVENMPVPEPTVSLPSLSNDEVPSECRAKDTYVDAGLPVFSKRDRSVHYGVSLPQNHVVTPSPVPLYVWAYNTSDQDVNVSDSCDLIRNAGIHLRPLHGHTLSKRETSPRSQLCSVQVPVRIPAHNCFAFAKVDLNDIYELHSGVYRVLTGKENGEKRGGTEQRDSLFFQYQRLVPSR